MHCLDVRDKLTEEKFYVEEKRGDKRGEEGVDKKKKTFRWQKHVSRARIKVPYVKYCHL